MWEEKLCLGKYGKGKYCKDIGQNTEMLENWINKVDK